MIVYGCQAKPCAVKPPSCLQRVCAPPALAAPQRLALWPAPAAAHNLPGLCTMLCCAVLQVSLASDFMYNINTRDATATFGYDYILRQCRLRGRIDSGACRGGEGV